MRVKYETNIIFQKLTYIRHVIRYSEALPFKVETHCETYSIKDLQIKAISHKW